MREMFGAQFHLANQRADSSVRRGGSQAEITMQRKIITQPRMDTDGHGYQMFV